MIQRKRANRPDILVRKSVIWRKELMAASTPQQKNFPDAAAGGPIVNPTHEDPAAHLDFVFDPVAKLATVTPKTTRGATTIRVLGLNRHELRAHRSRLITRLAYIASHAANDLEAANLLATARMDAGEYAAFARLPQARVL